MAKQLTVTELKALMLDDYSWDLRELKDFLLDPQDGHIGQWTCVNGMEGQVSAATFEQAKAELLQSELSGL